jgi:hypothetical protein
MCGLVNCSTPGESSEILDLTDIQPLAEDATLTVRVWSNNESDRIEPDHHHLLVSLNGEQVGEHFWDGKSSGNGFGLRSLGICYSRKAMC